METAYVPVNGFVYREDGPAAAFPASLSLFNLPLFRLVTVRPWFSCISDLFIIREYFARKKLLGPFGDVHPSVRSLAQLVSIEYGSIEASTVEILTVHPEIILHHVITFVA